MSNDSNKVEVKISKQTDGTFVAKCAKCEAQLGRPSSERNALFAAAVYIKHQCVKQETGSA